MVTWRRHLRKGSIARPRHLGAARLLAPRPSLEWRRGVSYRGVCGRGLGRVGFGIGGIRGSGAGWIAVARSAKKSEAARKPGRIDHHTSALPRLWATHQEKPEKAGI